jgi:hypothetical protein
MQNDILSKVEFVGNTAIKKFIGFYSVMGSARKVVISSKKPDQFPKSVRFIPLLV